MQAGTWYHVVLVWENGNFEVFMNASLVDQGLYTGFNILDSTCITLGAFHNCDADTFAQFYDGQLDEVQVYPRALSVQQISQLYADGDAGVGGPTIIDDAHTTSGQVWFLSVRPINYLGVTGGLVNSANTVEVLPFEILSVSPAKNDIDVFTSANVVITFTEGVGGTIDATTLPIYGSQSGLL